VTKTVIHAQFEGERRDDARRAPLSTVGAVKVGLTVFAPVSVTALPDPARKSALRSLAASGVGLRPNQPIVFACSTRITFPPSTWRMASSLWPRMTMPRVKSGQFVHATL
jgi:hypothetical protein